MNLVADAGTLVQGPHPELTDLASRRKKRGRDQEEEDRGHGRPGRHGALETGADRLDQA